MIEEPSPLDFPEIDPFLGAQEDCTPFLEPISDDELQSLLDGPEDTSYDLSGWTDFFFDDLPVDIQNSKNQRKRKLSAVSSDDTSVSSSSTSSGPVSARRVEKQQYYQRKQAVVRKLKHLLTIPPLICSASNAGDEAVLQSLVETYFSEDCQYSTKAASSVGRAAMVKNLLILDEACPDVVRVYKDVRLEEGEVRFNFSFSGTKQYTSSADRYFDPLTAPVASERMVQRASIIRGMGKKYVYFGTGTGNLKVSPDATRFTAFYVSAHRCDVRVSSISDEVEGEGGEGKREE